MISAFFAVFSSSYIDLFVPKAFAEDAAEEESVSETAAWEEARDKRDAAQKAYTDASVEYNKCVAAKSAKECKDLKTKMDTAKEDLNSASKELTKAQKETSKAVNKNIKAENKAYEKAKKALEKCQKKEDADCSAEQKAFDEAKAKVDARKGVDETSEQEGLQSFKSQFDATSDYGAQSDAVNRMRSYMNGKEAEAKKAEEECARYSAMTSKDAQEKAKDACSQAVALRKEADEAKATYNEYLQKFNTISLSPSVISAQRQLKSAEKGGTGVVDISQSRQIGDSGDYTLAGYKSKYFNYQSGSDVLDTVTRRAALAVVSLKPIVYVFAGFGLIAFAWMAIFNKISWKWFANIAMGLFLVANMGRFIEYFVVGDGNSHYYIGVWNSNATQTGGENSLANAFADTYYVYGDTDYNDIGIRDFIDKSSEEGAQEIKEEFKLSAAGFCQGTSGSSLANFTSCVKDIVSTAKKAADTIKTVKSTVEDIKARVETVKDSVANIKQTFEAMKGGSITDIIAGVGNILNNVNSVVSTTTGAVGSITNAASNISNNIQDMGKSVDQQKELQDRRNSGEATNAFDALLKGQEWNSATGGVENVDGQWAGEDNFITKVGDMADYLKDQSSTMNDLGGGLLGQIGSISNIVENASLGGESINERRQREQAEKEAQQKEQERAAAKEEYLNSNAGKNENYMTQNSRVNNLYNNIQQQQNELDQLKNQQQAAQAAVDRNCSGPNDTSATCSAARKSKEAIDSAIVSKEEQIKTTQAEYETAKEDREKAYQEALDSNIAEAEKQYEEASKRADEICQANAGSTECAKAKQDVVDASNKLLDYTKEKEQGPQDENAIAKEEYLNSNAGKNETYMNQANETSNLYDSIQQQEREIDQMKQQQEDAQDMVNKSCSGPEDTSTLCTVARNNKEAIDNMLQSKEKQLEDTKAEYETSKEKLEEAYNEALDSNIAEAEKQYEEANKRAEEACNENPGSDECIKARQEIVDASNKLIDYMNEKENKTGESKYDTKEDIVNNLASSQEEQKRQDIEDQLDFEQEQLEDRQNNEGYYASQEYQQSVDKADNLYTQLNTLEQESEQLQEEINKKEEEAADACAKDPGGAACYTANIAVNAAKEALSNKEEQINQTRQAYSEAKQDVEESYQNMLDANQNQAKNDLERANEAADNAKQRLDEINSQIGDAATSVDTARSEYNQAVSEAQAARDAYNQAVAEGKSQEEIDRLKDIYNDKLSAMSDKKEEYDSKSQEYNNLSQEKQEAENAYNQSKEDAKDAADRLSSYTNEDVNNTDDSRINSREDTENQIMLDQYLSDTNPNAEAQASKNNYIEQKNKKDIAEYTLKEKESLANQLYKDYQEAENKCNQSKLDEDCRLAERLQKNYELAKNELDAARNDYNKLRQEMSVYEKDYIQKAIAAEKYNQQKYTDDMKIASSDINKYEVAVSKQRQAVDDAALEYTEAKNALEEGDQVGLNKTVQLYKAYLEAKDLYNSYQNSLNQARNKYNKANSDYQNSLSEQKRLENELSKM